MVSIWTNVDFWWGSGWARPAEYDELVAWLIENVGPEGDSWIVNELPGMKTEIVIWDNNKATLTALRWK
jgi:hypothetical protein